ncbi:MAG: DUF2096 domain-containing protein [Euryarchaeota archaeon]|nr:DUF2096 domain-containing protein [Euryarchaeota archaeon]
MSRRDMLSQRWLATMDMLVEVLRQGAKPEGVSELLRNSKSMLNDLRTRGTEEPEILMRIEAALDEAQMRIFTSAEQLGSEFLERWTEVFENIRRGGVYREEEPLPARFYPRLPRSGRWARIRLTSRLTPAKLLEISRKHGVKIKKHGREHVIILGERRALRNALREALEIE